MSPRRRDAPAKGSTRSRTRDAGATVLQSRRAQAAGVRPSVIAASPASTTTEKIERVLARYGGGELRGAACKAEFLASSALRA